MMKTYRHQYIALLLTLVTALSLFPRAISLAKTSEAPLPEFTADDYVSLWELSEQALDGWHETYIAKEREVVVKVDIPWMPTAEECPIVQVEAWGKDQLSEDAFAPFEKYKTWNHIARQNIIFLMISDDTSYVSDQSASYRGKSAQQQELTFCYGEPPTEQAEGVDLTYEYFLSKVSQDIAHVSELTLDDYLFYKVQVDGITYKAKEKDGAMVLGDPLTKNGSYGLFGQQLFHGIPVLDIHDDYPDDMPLGHLMYTYYNPEYYYFNLQASQEVAVQTPDVPLLSFDAMKRVLVGQIENGNLRGIDKMEFGYLAFHQGKKNDRTWLLMPIWRIEGGYAENPNSENEVMPYHDPRDTDGSITVPSAYRYYYYSAQTGKMISSFAMNEKSLVMPAEGIVTWEAVGGKK